MTALAMFSVGTQTSYADEAVLTPIQTTVIQADGKTAQNANTVLCITQKQLLGAIHKLKSMEAHLQTCWQIMKAHLSF